MTSARAAAERGPTATGELLFTDIAPASVARSTRSTDASYAADGGFPAELFDIFSHMHHEIRTPLNAVIGFADLMQREMFGALGDARYREYAHHILDSGSRLLRITEQTLTMAALANDTADRSGETVSLADLVRDALCPLGLTSGAKERSPCRTVDIDIADGMLIRADAAATRLALETLIAGALSIATPCAKLAIKASSHLGRITLAVTLEPSASGQATVTTSSAGVSDIAIARELLRLQRIVLVDSGRRGDHWCMEIRFEEARQAALL